ncbi:uncharacterized protein C9orf43 homolog [Antechinus flavipes]|uniref:uncharacterized protein C9orf43 homolog n=1 Tax=Antechinus flavipes TaxID=38775 RepID=UPI002236C0C0|nr:uncharacterized protein C9orf43 homolog [Antechinus flavipes]
MANDLEVDFYSQPVINIRLPDLSQLDETTCSQLVCQHPHCWAAIRRLQRGHPRILQPISRPPKKSEDELPTLKIVDLSLPDSFILAKRISDSVPFFKHPPSLSGDSKLESDLQSSVEEPLLGFRSLRDFHGRDFGQNRRKPAKLPVLNLNSTYIPKSPDGGNLVMVWIPDEPVKYKRPDQKCRTKLSPVPLKNNKAIPSSERISKRAAQKKKKTTQVPTGGQPCSAQLIHRWLKVLPPSPVTMPSNMGSLSSWDFTFPKKSLMSSLSNEEKAIAKMDQLDVIDEESLFHKRHQFKLSKTKMILAVHRINLQSPVLRYPANMKELHSRTARTIPIKKKGLKIPMQKSDRAAREPGLSKNEKPQSSEMELKESKKKKEFLALNRVSLTRNFLPQKDSIVSAKEEQIQKHSVVADKAQVQKPKAQNVKTEESSEVPLAVDEKKLKEEPSDSIQIPQASEEQEDEPPTPPTSRE